MKYAKGTLNLKDGVFTLDGEPILDCSNAYFNKSRVPIFKAPLGSSILADRLLSLKDFYLSLNTGTKYEKYAGLFRMISVIVSDHCMRNGEPLKVCEIGCNSGALTQDIATVLTWFDPDAKYVCVSNAIGNESDMEWVDRISCIDVPAGLALHVSDFHDTSLRDDYFDITIINGCVPIPDPVKTVKEAGRITKNDGMIICYSEEQYLLDDGMRMMFDKKTEWRFTGTRVLYRAFKKDMWHE